MKVKVKVIVGLIALICTSLVHAQTEIKYWMKELPSLGGVVSKANAINDAGQIVGYSTELAGSNKTPVIWERSGNAIQLSSLATIDNNVEAVDINSSGEIIGNGLDPMYWLDKSMMASELPFSSTVISAIVTAINDEGTIVGQKYYGVVPTLNRAIRIDKHTNGSYLSEYNLGWYQHFYNQPSGSWKPETMALDINDSGMIVGWTNDRGHIPPATNETTILGMVWGGSQYQNSTLSAINNHSEVGLNTNASVSGTPCYIREAGSGIVTTIANGEGLCEVKAVNDNRYAIAQVGSGNKLHVYEKISPTGGFTTITNVDINDVVINSDELEIRSLSDINNQNEIVGTAINSVGNEIGILLSPVPSEIDVDEQGSGAGYNGWVLIHAPVDFLIPLPGTHWTNHGTYFSADADSNNFFQWNFSVVADGEYQLTASIPDTGSNTTSAIYTLPNDSGYLTSTVDQDLYKEMDYVFSTNLVLTGGVKYTVTIRGGASGNLAVDNINLELVD